MSDGVERPETPDLPVSEPSSPVSDEIAAAGIQRDEQLAGASNSEIDREVAEAFAEMSEADRAELGGEVITGEDVAPGAEITGRVVSVSDDDIFMEFGAKSQGVLPRSQFGKKEEVEVGRRIDVVVERFDPETSLLIVNRKGAIQRATWTTLAVGAIVEGKVTGVIKGGLELDLKGIRAFMPGSQVDIAPMKDISVLLNEKVQCEVIELDRRAKNVLVSRRKLMERDRAQAKVKLLAELEVGQVRSGIVKTIMSYGAFVDLGGVDGLAHIRDLSWGSVDKVSDVLSPGQEVEVQVLKIDSAKERISLSVKHCQPDPWIDAETRFPVGSSHKARILRLASFGAFAELDKGIEGLIPMSEMGWNRLRSSSEAVSVGDVVDTVVIRLELDKHRLALSMKQAQPDPWEGVLDSYSAQSLVRGKVTRLAEFGAFVELAPGVEGLIHISELAEGRVKSCGSVVKTGEEIEARVLSVDKENRRISLSIKAVHSAAGSADSATSAPSDTEQAKPKKRKKKLRGGLSSHFDW